MVFHKRRNKKHIVKKFRLNINRVNIEQVNHIKYLGVILDNKLNWQKHIDYISTKLNRTAGIIFKLRKQVPSKVLLLIYNSLGSSYLRYALMAWGTVRNTALRKLQTLQNKIIRYMTYSPLMTNVTPKYKTLKIMNMEQLLQFDTLKFMYRYINFIKTHYQLHLMSILFISVMTTIPELSRMHNINFPHLERIKEKAASSIWVSRHGKN